MKRILFAALAACGLSGSALAQTAGAPGSSSSEPSNSSIGTGIQSTGPVGSSNLGGLSPVSPHVTDMDQPGTGMNGSIRSSTGLDTTVGPGTPDRTPDSMSWPSSPSLPENQGLPDVGAPSPGTSSQNPSGLSSGAGGASSSDTGTGVQDMGAGQVGQSPTTQPGVNR